jgi:hypothetical protein
MHWLPMTPERKQKIDINKTNRTKMGRACGAYGGGERCAQGVGREAWGKEAIGETKT